MFPTPAMITTAAVVGKKLVLGNADGDVLIGDTYFHLEVTQSEIDNYVSMTIECDNMLLLTGYFSRDGVIGAVNKLH